ncbi:ribonuclease HII [Stomatohabitans albus]|uniref:ribonuclease HII n=1 Tax=Stomatohabitans albus TaxID=3110766 RepID=UPI00300CA631
MHYSSSQAVPHLRHEQADWADGLVVGGIDEVGRGAGAGPVVHAVVVLDPDKPILKLRDSKTLTSAARSHLAERIYERAHAVGIGQASATEVDTIGLSRALQRSAERAINNLAIPLDSLLIDGNWDFCPHFSGKKTLITKGDRVSRSIAAASIVAKVYRDTLMIDQSHTYPIYGFEANKGYLSTTHLEAIAQHGPSPLHRMSWAPIRQLSLF